MARRRVSPIVTAALRILPSLPAVPTVGGIATSLSIGVTPKTASDLTLYYVFPILFVPEDTTTIATD